MFQHRFLVRKNFRSVLVQTRALKKYCVFVRMCVLATALRSTWLYLRCSTVANKRIINTPFRFITITDADSFLPAGSLNSLSRGHITVCTGCQRTSSLCARCMRLNVSRFPDSLEGRGEVFPFKICKLIFSSRRKSFRLLFCLDLGHAGIFSW